MKDEITRKQLRSFGFTVGGIFALIALWPLIIRVEDPRWWAVVVAACLVVPAAVFPRSLRGLTKAGWRSAMSWGGSTRELFSVSSSTLS